MEFVEIYHTNDIHSHFEYWPRIREFLKREKGEQEKAGNEVFLFDIGDFVDRWHPLSEGTKGKGNVQLLNECGYTAVTIGNNEGINFSYEDLNQLYEAATFDVLTANLYTGKEYPDWNLPYQIYKTEKGTRIGVIGLTAFFSELYQLMGWNLTEPISELKKWLPIVKNNSDVVVLLSHLGIHADEQIASEFPEIDVILGGHTHHSLKEGEKVNQSILAAAGKYGQYIGQVSLELNENRTIVHKRAILYDVAFLSAPEMEKEEAEELYEAGKELLSHEIIRLETPLVNDINSESDLSHLLCLSLKDWCQTDCAFINTGLILGSLSGAVTNYDLLAICPHPINPCKIELTGSQLENFFWEAMDDKWEQMPLKGLGFRGKIMGKFLCEGIFIHPEKENLMVNGMEIDLKKNYTVAIPDMLTFGNFFTDVYACKKRKYYLPEFLRDLLRWKLKNTFC